MVKDSKQGFSFFRFPNKIIAIDRMYFPFVKDI